MNSYVVWETQEDFVKILDNKSKEEALDFILLDRYVSLTCILRDLVKDKNKEDILREVSQELKNIRDLRKLISNIKPKLGNTKIMLGLQKSINGRLQIKIDRMKTKLDRVKNYSFWERVKFLFKKKGELL